MGLRQKEDLIQPMKDDVKWWSSSRLRCASSNGASRRYHAWTLSSIVVAMDLSRCAEEWLTVVSMGEQSTSLHQANAIKKGGPSWGSQDHHHLAQEDEVQGIGLPLIGFLFMIDWCTIKGGSQVSSLIVSFVESSNHLHPCIILLGSCLVFLFVGFRAYGHLRDKLEFIENRVHMHFLRCFRCWKFLPVLHS